MATPADRLQLLYDLARSVAGFTDLDALLRHATTRTRELLDAECCSVLLLDDARTHLFFPVASQAASGRAALARPEQLTFPAQLGVAGWVLSHDQTALVEDVSKDPRFYAAVDEATGRTTRALLCAPLRTGAGVIGVVEVMNPARGAFGAEDATFLEAIAADVAFACERARLYDRLRGESVGLRQVCRVAGLGLVGLGVMCAVGGLYAHLGSALPPGEVLTRWSTVTGVLLVTLGAALAAVARGWMIPGAEMRRAPEFYAPRARVS